MIQSAVLLGNGIAHCRYCTSFSHNQDLFRTLTARDSAAPRRLSVQDFIQFGLQDIADIRQVVVNGAIAFALHAADGTELALTLIPDKAIAAAALRQHELEPLSVR